MGGWVVSLSDSEGGRDWTGEEEGKGDLHPAQIPLSKHLSCFATPCPQGQKIPTLKGTLKETCRRSSRLGGAGAGCGV